MMFSFISQFYVKDDNSPTVVVLSSLLMNKSTSRTSLALTGRACGHTKGIEGITFYVSILHCCSVTLSLDEHHGDKLMY